MPCHIESKTIYRVTLIEPFSLFFCSVEILCYRSELHPNSASCHDANILPVVLGFDGQVLDAGAEKRLVEGPLRKILIARDGGCAFPQCDLPATWADAHHVIHWADGGPTTLENTVLLCRQHHTLVHHSAWKIVMRDGIPYFVPPWQIDPHQTPRRPVLSLPKGTVGTADPERSNGSGPGNPHHPRADPTSETRGHDPVGQTYCAPPPTSAER
ncbi:HNH endonuclease [Microbacteriaceae bacterium VKM Ac-2854]|nr:HNH endonuclease [Microbacteriaceae bacterium VKM Ac-2854]